MKRDRRLLPPETPAVLAAFAALAVCIAFGRFSLGLLLPDMRASLGMSYDAMGALASLNLCGYLAGVAAVPYLAKCTSHLRVVQVGILLATAGMFVTAVPVSHPVLAVAVLTTGVAGAMGWISSAAVGVEASAPHNKGVVLGMIGTANGVGIIIASGLALSFTSADGIDWRVVWLIQASVGALAVLCSLTVRPARRTPEMRPQSNVASLAKLHVAYAFFSMGYGWCATYFVASVQARSGQSGSAPWLLVGVGASVGALLFGAVGDRRGHARTLVITQGMAAISCVMMIVFERSGVAAGFAGLIFGTALASMSTLVPGVVGADGGRGRNADCLRQADARVCRHPGARAGFRRTHRRCDRRRVRDALRGRRSDVRAGGGIVLEEQARG